MRIFFINPRPACCETEKGGEGERDNDRIVKGCHQERIAWGYLLYLLTRQVERCGGEPPLPPPLDTLLLTSLRMQQQIFRIASWVWRLILDSNNDHLCFFGFFIGRLISRDCYGLAENSENSGGRQVFGLRQKFNHFSMAGRYKQPVQYGKRVRPKTRASGAPSSLGIYIYTIQHISKEENETISVTREKSAVAFAEPKQ